MQKWVLIVLKKQISLPLSEYNAIYQLVIPRDNLLRRIREEVSFAFVYEELVSKYCLDNGRNAIDPARMLKYLFLKSMFQLSDVDVVERSRYDMSFKYFLEMTPEEDVIHSSSLTKFRKMRLNDVGLMDLLIQKSVELAIAKGIIKSTTIIVDSTHTFARYNSTSPRERLRELSKSLRHSVYELDPEIKNKLPPQVNNGILETEIIYSQKLIKTIEENEVLSNYPKVCERINALREAVDDDLEQLALSKDEDAKVGHKTADTSFFGYKTHLAMTPERIITAAEVTSGEKTDGKQLQALVEKSQAAGIEVKVVVGDAAYSERGNLEYAKEHDIQLVAKLSQTVTHGTNSRHAADFEFNKDAEMYVCKAGHMSTHKVNSRAKKHAEDGKGATQTYYFDVEKCRICPHRTGCYTPGAKSKSFSVHTKAVVLTDHMAFQESDEFKELAKDRYMIESKNSELKNGHGYDQASSSGLAGMTIQAATTIFMVNLKRIFRLMT